MPLGSTVSTVLDVVRLSTRHLSERGCDSPRLDAELLAAHALGLRRIDLYLQHDRPLDETELEPVRALLRRRTGGEPVAYILGEREFYSRPFAVSPAVLIPRPESELLVERALHWLRGREGGRADGDASLGAGLEAVDLGTGSGCLAVTLAATAPALRVVAADVSGEALSVAGSNVARHGVAERVALRQGSWWDAVGEATFDLLIANPPYVAEAELSALAREVREHEPRGALVAGSDGLDAYRAVLGGAPEHLRAAGLILLEIPPQLAAAVTTLVHAAWPAAEVAVHADLAGLDRCVEARLP